MSQVLAQLKFPDPQMLALLGGTRVMIESPLLQEMKAEVLREAIREVLKARFGKVPADVRRLLADTRKEKLLIRLNVLAAQCATLDEFKENLLT